MKRIAIVQSNYIPWKGYFDLIAHVDEFVLLDDVQYTHSDWRNRNRIKTATGTRWLTIPVERHPLNKLINEATTNDPTWRSRHWKTLAQTYRKAPCFDEVAPGLERLYQECDSGRVSEINRHFLTGLCRMLGIRATFTRSEDYGARGSKTERVVDLCLKAGADRYLTGPAARAYLDEGLFRRAGIEVDWFDYSGYPEYPQLHPPFEHNVTVLDLIFHTGAAACGYLKSAVRASTRG